MSAASLRNIVLSCFLAAGVSSACADSAQNITGYWDILDKSGNLDTTIEIYESGFVGVLEGRVVKLHRPQDQGAICTACSGERHNQPILTMKVITDLQWNPKKNGWYGNGLDPERGWEPRVRLRLEGNELKVCAHYKTDFICLDKDSWTQRQTDETFLSSLPDFANPKG
ncbi:DUF2147 domain-containing protein [Sansalvadorimonas sp. 2012CJ34-2]|uniref:DUF2147 domain-containing protein n=1 Tax=Parendozoicomonas callyspongiae TaxID=2942213 RepID=A0ABT0PHR7_9GAMM|nr:DUF2147 domain-containing protein [Sansalvadorimonas sp. 2012CJ34-2]MCL6270918.1 DUF2147 domain-containing protein [Sansalvadorimonas sp. 2012CJ34-2]